MMSYSSLKYLTDVETLNFKKLKLGALFDYVTDSNVLKCHKLLRDKLMKQLT